MVSVLLWDVMCANECTVLHRPLNMKLHMNVDTSGALHRTTSVGRHDKRTRTTKPYMVPDMLVADQEGENTVRQADVTKLLKQYGHERGTLHCLMRLAEEQEDTKRTIAEIGEVMEQMSNVLNMHNTVMDNMKDKIDAYRIRDDDPRSTHALISSAGNGDDDA